MTPGSADIIVHSMNIKGQNQTPVSESQLAQFQDLIAHLFQCCQERMQYQSERFGLPDAELRCLMLFGQERYLTSKGIAKKMKVVKSRVSKIIEGMEEKGYIRRIKDPQDSRVVLLALTQKGEMKWNEIDMFLKGVHQKVLLHMPNEQRTSAISALEILKTSMESVKELMADDDGSMDWQC